jgi:two-component system invasion response regulator UvrY
MGVRLQKPESETRVAVCASWPVLVAGVCALLTAERAVVPVPLVGTPDEMRARVAAEHPDVVLLIDVPGGDASAFDAVLSACADVAPVIVLGALPDRASVTRLLDAGARGCVDGTCPVAELLEAITRVRSGKGYLCPATAHSFVGVGGEPRRPVRPRLTARETEVLRLLARGHTSGEIARRFGLSVRTIHTHRAQILRKVGVRTTTALVRAALRAGLLEPGGGASG